MGVIVEVSVRVLVDDAGGDPLATAARTEQVVQTPDVEETVLKAQARIVELCDAARDSANRQLAEQFNGYKPPEDSGGRPRPVGRRP
jgi:hypothetical protein